ncbi:hypothetical protein ABG807_04685 [Streptococcus iniae]
MVLTQLIPLVQQSPDTFSTAQLDTLYSWINKAFLPLIVKGELMDMSRVVLLVGKAQMHTMQLLRFSVDYYDSQTCLKMIAIASCKAP